VQKIIAESREQRAEGKEQRAENVPLGTKYRYQMGMETLFRPVSSRTGRNFPPIRFFYPQSLSGFKLTIHFFASLVAVQLPCGNPTFLKPYFLSNPTLVAKFNNSLRLTLFTLFPMRKQAC
jgi:hypothetical protein